MIEKKKGLRGLKIPKRILSLVFAVGRKGKENVCFSTSRLFFIVQTCFSERYTLKKSVFSQIFSGFAQTSGMGHLTT